MSERAWGLLLPAEVDHPLQHSILLGWTPPIKVLVLWHGLHHKAAAIGRFRLWHASLTLARPTQSVPSTASAHGNVWNQQGIPGKAHEHGEELPLIMLKSV